MVVSEPLNKDQLQIKYGIGGNTRVFEWCKKYGKLHYPGKGSIGAPMKDPQKRRIKELADTQLKLLAYEKLIFYSREKRRDQYPKKDAARQLPSLPKHTPKK